MSSKFEFTPVKTYATEANADRAVAKAGFEELRHFIIKSGDNRFFPVFVGHPALEAGVQFHFNVVA